MIWFDDEQVLCFDPARCCQCGACLAACPTGALARRDALDGRFDIVWNGEMCINCGRCASVCPAPDLPLRRWTENSWGAVESCWLGHSVDGERRIESSSGGVIRTLIESAVESGLVHEAYCLLEDDESPWVRGGYLPAGFPVSRLANSTYRPVPFLENLEELRRSGGKLVVAGTNCQLMAVEKFYSGVDLELLRIGILCKQQKDLRFTRFIRRRLGLSPDGKDRVSYRGDGWPGKMTARGRSIEWADAAALPFGRGLWTLPACRYCANAMGERADITVADPWNIVRAADSGGGLSLIVVHTGRGRELLESSAGAIGLESVGVDAVRRSIDWPSLSRKIENVSIRASKRRSLSQRLRIGIRDLTRKRLERLLERWTPPSALLRLIARIPLSPW